MYLLDWCISVGLVPVCCRCSCQIAEEGIFLPDYSSWRMVFAWEISRLFHMNSAYCSPLFSCCSFEFLLCVIGYIGGVINWCHSTKIDQKMTSVVRFCMTISFFVWLIFIFYHWPRHLHMLRAALKVVQTISMTLRWARCTRYGGLCVFTGVELIQQYHMPILQN